MQAPPLDTQRTSYVSAGSPALPGDQPIVTPVVVTLVVVSEVGAPGAVVLVVTCTEVDVAAHPVVAALAAITQHVNVVPAAKPFTYQEVISRP